jgi:hypothetical protein
MDVRLFHSGFAVVYPRPRPQVLVETNFTKTTYLVILISYQDNFGSVENFIQTAITSYFMNIFQFQNSLYQNRLLE